MTRTLRRRLRLARNSLTASIAATAAFAFSIYVLLGWLADAINFLVS